MIATGAVVAGRYEILDRISEGGMAEVFRARRTDDAQVVALKVLRGQFARDTEFVERFQREARAVRELSHPHMVRVYDSGRDGDVHFIAMEYVEGEDLKAHLRRVGRVAPERAVAIATQVLEALAYAHVHGIVHRDVKPQNILLTAEGAVKVTDFGIARAMSSATITQTGTVLGSVHYLSPEQARGEAVGRATDIYSLGVVLYEMVTGALPFDGDSPIAIALAHVNAAPAPPRTLVPALPQALDGIIRVALAKTPARRYGSAEEMRDDLLGVSRHWGELAAQGAAEPTPPAAARGGRARRRSVPRAVATLTAAAVLLGGAWSGWRAFSGYLTVPEMEVPNLVSRPLRVAQQEAAAAGVVLSVTERTYSTTVPAESVIAQDQPPGKRVKRGRVVGVTVSLGPEIVQVPDVQRRSLIEARLLIERARLAVGELREQYDSEVRSGFVLAQDPQPLARVERDRAVNLVISKGPPRVEMPPLVGRPLREARQVLEDLGITLAEVKTSPTSDLEPGIVVDQSPGAGTQITPSDRVTVTVTVRPGEEQTPPPTPVVTAQPQPTSREDEKVTTVQLIVPEGDPAQDVRIVVVDEGGVRTVFHQTLAPGARVEETIRTRGYTIIQVFISNRLVQEIRP